MGYKRQNLFGKITTKSDKDAEVSMMNQKFAGLDMYVT